MFRKTATNVLPAIHLFTYWEIPWESVETDRAT